MISININTNIPIFEQIVLEIGKLIALDILKPNEKLPPVRTLAKDLGINPNTVAKAYSECESQGLIYSIPGKGSYITTQTNSLTNLVEGAYEELNECIIKLKSLGESAEAIMNYIKENHI